MTYRKFKADYLFDGQEMAEKDAVLITTTDGTVQAIVPEADAGGEVEVHRGLLSPGFINCHCHLELSHMRGVIPEGTGLVDFLSTVIRGRGDAGGSTSEVIAQAIMRGEQEMLDNGIVAVGDICNTTDTLEVKRVGRLFYHNFIETLGFIEAGAAARFAHSRGVFDGFEEVLPGSGSIVPHAPYSVSAALLRLIADFPGNRLLTIHNQEAAAENDFFLTGKGDFLRLYEALGVDVSFFKGTGKRSPESILPYFHGCQTLILVHNTATGEEDFQAIREMGGPELFFCLCPNANLYIEGKLPDVGLFVREGCRLVIGTDSLASNHQLSILEELKTLQRAFPGLDTVELLRWATLNGARALGMEERLGSLGGGKRPGVVVIEGGEGDRLTAGTRVRRLL